MSGAKQHYEALLGGVYAWSVTGGGDPHERAASWIARHGFDGGTSYLDLGAGFGAHVLPLVRAGKRVTAVDFDATLLTQLADGLGDQAGQVSIHEDDLLHFLRAAGAASWDVILCLGDTLTHLPDVTAVQDLLAEGARHLATGGRLALAYRDSTRFAAEGVARFIPVARDEKRTMHCLLEPIDDEHLRVTDIVTDVLADGPRTRISDYVKLRLAPARVASWAREAGLETLRETEERGLVTQIFAKPA